MAETVKLEIMTPKEMFFSGDVETLIAKSEDGYEGFLPHHRWAVKLLAKDGKLQIRRPGEANLRSIRSKGGVVEIRDHFVVVTNDAKWIEE